MNHQVYGLLLLQRRQVAECVVGFWGVLARRLSVVVYAGGPAYKRRVGLGTIVFRAPPAVWSVVAVSYSPTPSQVQYHRRLRA